MATLTTASTPATKTFTPAAPPPPGVTSNPSNPASLAYRSDIAIGVCLPLITVFFLLRSYVRYWVKGTWILEDWLVLTAWVGTCAYCGIMATTMANHGGEHIWDITAAQTKEAAYWFNVASVEYAPTICITKLAVLLLYRRVFSPRRWSVFDTTIFVLIVLLIGFYTATIIVKIFECTPRAKIVDKTIPGTCVNIPVLLNTSGVFNTITDFMILFLPVHAVWKLQMSPQRKFLVILVFTFGSCAPAFSTIGAVVRFKISSNPDTTWNQPEILLWACAELTSGILCVCFPEMAFLFNCKSRKTSRSSRPSTYIRNRVAAESRPSKSNKLGITSKNYTELGDDGIYGANIALGEHSSDFEMYQNGQVHVSHETVKSDMHEAV